MRLRRQFGLVLGAVLAVLPPARAHHSYAMFDATREVELVGVVKEFQWTNPHIWIELVVDQQGKSVLYSIEGGATQSLARHGFRRTIFKPGDTVTVVVNPLKSGEPGGSFVRAIAADGQLVTDR